MISRKGILLVSIAIFFAFAIMVLSFDMYNESLLGIILLLSSLLFSIPFICKDNKIISTYMFRPFIVFLLGYFIVFFQKYYDLYLGLTSTDDSVFWNKELIIYSLLLSSLGLAALMIGYYGSACNKQKQKKSTPRIIPAEKLRYLMILATFLVIVFNAKGFINGNYSQEELEKNAGGMSNYSSILYVVVYFALVSLTVYNCRLLKKQRLKDFANEFGFKNIICVLIYMLLLIVGGSRSNVIIIMTSLVFSLFYIRNVKIKFLYIIIGVAIFSYALSFIGITRNLRGKSLAEKAQAVESVNLERKSISPPTLELAGSLETFNASLDYVPNKHDFLYGSFHVRNIVSTIPFSSRVSSHFFDNRKRYQSSDFFVTYIIQGEYYTYGNGTSINADLYLNYGALGIIVGLFILGMIFRKTENHVLLEDTPSLNYIILFLFMMGYALPYSRNGFLAPINYIMFTYILLYFYKRRFVKMIK